MSTGHVAVASAAGVQPISGASVAGIQPIALAGQNPVITMGAGNVTLSAAQSGATCLVTTNSGAASNIQLPAPTAAGSAGLFYRFLNSPGGSSGNNAVINSTAGGINGVLYNGNLGVVSKSNATSANFLAAASLSGDQIQVCCDGLQWAILGWARTAASLS